MRKRTLTLLMVVGLAACGDEDPNEPIVVDSEYSLSITGAMTETASGAAYFGEDEDEEGNPVWALLMGQDTSRHLVMLVRAGSQQPATGALDIVAPTEDGWNLLHFVTDGDELVDMFVADSGGVTLSKSTDDEVSGTIRFWATGLFTSSELEVSGSFTAVPAPASMMTALSAGGL